MQISPRTHKLKTLYLKAHKNSCTIPYQIIYTIYTFQINIQIRFYLYINSYQKIAILISIVKQEVSNKMNIQKVQIRYYCYSCQSHFNIFTEMFSCMMCDSSAIQMIKEMKQLSSPPKFDIFELKSEQHNRKQVGSLDNGIVPRGSTAMRTVVSIVSTSRHSLEDFAQGSFLGNLLRQHIRDGDRPAGASAQQVGKLQKISRVKQCSICQNHQQQADLTQQNQEQPSQQNPEGYKLSCGHTFHSTCIHPWFQRSNRCPLCRRSIQE